MENSKSKIKLSVVIPCYNEEKILPETIRNLERFFFRTRHLFQYEILFVDDGSTDSTSNIIKEYATHNKHIFQCGYKYNVGKGYAVGFGIEYSKYHNIMILDADLSVRPDEVLKLIPELRKSEKMLVVGQRIQVEEQPFYRIIAGKSFSFLQKIILNLGLEDSQCPFKLLIHIGDISSYLEIDGFAYDCELIYKAKKNKIKIKTMPVKYYNVEDSRVTIWKTIKMFFELLKIRFS
jgi:dolichyl-phosphate beta-glucosyltransferase